MKIVHTADWHLGDRLDRLDRTDDLRRAVERVAAYCAEEQADVLLVAGDLFSELSRPDSLRASMEHLAEIFMPFLARGGTIIAVTGNHDNENFCQTLRQVLRLAAPEVAAAGAVVPPGRFYLAAHPTFFRLADRDGAEVQFVLMPYPLASRYLDETKQRYSSLEEKHKALQQAFSARLQAIRTSADFRPDVPTVLAAHIHVQSAVMPSLFRLTERESIIFPDSDVPKDWAYVAFGHIHQAQSLMGLPHVRYAGSIERLDMGERDDRKSVAFVEIGPEGRRGPPRLLPLEATPIYDVVITNPREELPQLRRRYPDHERALVRLHLEYTPGQDNLQDILSELDAIFPRWYKREWCEVSALGPAQAARDPTPTLKSFHETVLDYIDAELADNPAHKEVRKLAESLLAEE
jgi:exonuclease SbcD